MLLYENAGGGAFRQDYAYLDLLNRYWSTYDNIFSRPAVSWLIAPHVTRTGDKMFSARRHTSPLELRPIVDEEVEYAWQRSALC
jgi:hypothetical protein